MKTNTVLTKLLSKVNPYDQPFEQHLIKEAKNGNIKSRNKLIESHLKYVVKQASIYQYKWQHVSMDDLIAEGILGIIKAIKRYDVNKQVKFISYAHWWITKYMKNFICSQSRTVTIPMRLIEKKRHSNIDADRISLTNQCISIYDKIEFDEPVSSDTSSIDLIQEADLINEINIEIEKLTEPQKIVIKNYYLNTKAGGTPYIYSDISKMIKKCDSMCRRINERSLEAMSKSKILKEHYMALTGS